MSPLATRRLLSLHRICGLVVGLNMAVFALTGLVLALLADGLGDGLALALLCLPWVLTAVYVSRAPSRERR